jgi:hypothetical protein
MDALRAGTEVAVICVVPQLPDAHRPTGESGRTPAAGPVFPLLAGPARKIRSSSAASQPSQRAQRFSPAPRQRFINLAICYLHVIYFVKRDIIAPASLAIFPTIRCSVLFRTEAAGFNPVCSNRRHASTVPPKGAP